MQPPSPPSNKQKCLYLSQDKTFLYLAGLISLSCLVTSMSLFAAQSPWLLPYLGFTGLLAIYLFISYSIGIFGKPFDLDLHHKILRNHLEFRPSVDIFLPSCGEDIDVLRNTFLHVSRIEWAEKQVYVLDDKGLDEVRQLAERFGFAYFSRPNKGELKKAGNLRYAFARTAGDFIVIFDADFAPRPDFIKELIPYFDYDPRIAIVQSPQFFEALPEMNWIQRGAGSVQELFYRLIQVSRNTWGASICVGSNAIYRRSALEPFGGTAAIEHSEDVHTGFSVIELGWRIMYVPLNLAKGLCPDNVRAFFTQQYRWSTGSLSLFLNQRFWKSKIGAVVRLNYLSGMLYYASTALGIFLSPLPAIVMVWFFPDQIYWYNYLLIIPSTVFGFYLWKWNRAPFGFFCLKTRTLAYYAHLFALMDKMTRSTRAWVPTGTNIGAKASRFPAFRCVLAVWTGLYGGLIIVGLVRQPDWLQNHHFYPMLLYTGLNLAINASLLLDVFDVPGFGSRTEKDKLPVLVGSNLAGTTIETSPDSRK